MSNAANTASKAPRKSVNASDRKVSKTDNGAPVIIDVNATVGALMDGDSQNENRQLALAIGLFSNESPDLNEKALRAVIIDTKPREVLIDNSKKKFTNTQLLLRTASPIYAERLARMDTKAAKIKATKDNYLAAARIAVEFDELQRQLRAADKMCQRAVKCALALYYVKARKLDYDAKRGCVTIEYSDATGGSTSGIFSAAKLIKLYDARRPGAVSAASKPGGTSTASTPASNTSSMLAVSKGTLASTAGLIDSFTNDRTAEVSDDLDRVFRSIILKKFREPTVDGKMAVAMDEVAAYVKKMLEGYSDKLLVVAKGSDIVPPKDAAAKPAKPAKAA